MFHSRSEHTLSDVTASGLSCSVKAQPLAKTSKPLFTSQCGGLADIQHGSRKGRTVSDTESTTFPFSILLSSLGFRNLSVGGSPIYFAGLLKKLREGKLPAWCLVHMKWLLVAPLRKEGYLSVVLKKRCRHLKFSSNRSRVRIMDG